MMKYVRVEVQRAATKRTADRSIRKAKRQTINLRMDVFTAVPL